MSIKKVEELKKLCYKYFHSQCQWTLKTNLQNVVFTRGSQDEIHSCSEISKIADACTTLEPEMDDLIRRVIKKAVREMFNLAIKEAEEKAIEEAREFLCIVDAKTSLSFEFLKAEVLEIIRSSSVSIAELHRKLRNRCSTKCLQNILADLVKDRLIYRYEDACFRYQSSD